MKTLIIYDSFFGNTKLIANEIAKEFQNSEVISVSNFTKDNLKDVNLLIIGSPIRGWRPSEKIIAMLDNFKEDDLKGVKATAYDTRVKLFIHGDAKDQIAKKLARAGAEIITEPACFYVKGSEGPLLDGELEKAVKWAKRIK